MLDEADLHVCTPQLAHNHYLKHVIQSWACVECRPPMGGTAPSTRFRHTLAPIRPSPGSSMEVQIIDALGSDKRIENGELLFCFGGYNTIGEEFGANSTFVSP